MGSRDRLSNNRVKVTVGKNLWFWGIVVATFIAVLSLPSVQPAGAAINMPAFVNVGPEVGINLVREMYGHNLIDYNNDGRLDLFFPNHNKHPLNLFQQQPSGQMVDVAAQVRLGPSADHHGAAWGDCNNDGLPDLYIAIGADGGKGDNPKLLYKQLANHTFVEIAASAGVDDPLGRGRSSTWVDYNNDGRLDLYVTNIERIDNRNSPDKLYRNDGNCTFTRVKVGALTSGNYSSGAAWGDYDNDGDMDVIAASSSAIALYRNERGRFDDVTRTAGILDEAGGAGLAWGDYNNDGYLDLFAARGWSPNAHSTPSPNRLYRNNGNGTFTGVETVAGVDDNFNSQAATWADFNNDGYLDLYVTNAGLLSTSNKPNFLYMNKGNGTFEEVARPVGAAGNTGAGLSGGVAIGDVNADGFLDIVLSNGNQAYGEGFGRNQLLLNQRNGAHWLQLKLVGRQSNRLGIGARVVVITADGFPQKREMNGGVHHFSQNEMLLHFGLGQRTKISKVIIRWPSGRVQQLSGVAVDRRLMVVEPLTPPPPPKRKVWLPWLVDASKYKD